MKLLLTGLLLGVLLGGCQKSDPAPPPSSLRLTIDGRAVVCDRDIRASTAHNPQYLHAYGNWATGSVELEMFRFADTLGTRYLSFDNRLTLHSDGVYSSYSGYGVSDTGRIVVRAVSPTHIRGTFTGRVVGPFGPPRLITNGEFSISRPE
ncbi:hypothetical protein [Hymenobacter algoricola]|uniref:Lipoprotein n=1 Tax=Hymenobacter algoricola TaxID=486267 RepID=A0ABP7NQU1_9BACT